MFAKIKARLRKGEKFTYVKERPRQTQVSGDQANTLVESTTLLIQKDDKPAYEHASAAIHETVPTAASVDGTLPHDNTPNDKTAADRGPPNTAYWTRALKKLQEGKPEIAAKLESLLHDAAVTIYDSSTSPAQSLDVQSTGDQAALAHVGKRAQVPTTTGANLPLNDNIRVIVNTKLGVMTDKQWRWRWGTRNIRIRSVLEKVAESISAFKDIISPIAQMDPSHAGIAWAGVCVLMPVGTPTACYAVTLSYMAFFICCYSRLT
jgi:hypothetical protein